MSRQKFLLVAQKSWGLLLKYSAIFIRLAIQFTVWVTIYGSKISRYSLRRTSIMLKRWYKYWHHYLAHKPHLHLSNKYSKYKTWHEWDKHKRVHYAVFGVYMIVIGSMLFASLSRVLAASDLFDNWDFSTPSQYSLDDGLEISGNSVRMKAQNYSDDANTKALFHLDESSGTTVHDSSTNNNDGTVKDESWQTGNLNNALGLNGTTSKISVPDSPSLSLSQNNTIEGWTKFSSNFSAGSHEQRQAIVDKGDYQMYFDNETGKLTYELANNSATGWTKSAGDDVNGSWGLNGKNAVSSSVTVGSDVYAGTGVATKDAEVYKYSGSTWSKIGGDGVNSSWSGEHEYVLSMATDGTNVFVGLGTGAGDAEVWRWNGSSWSKIGGDANTPGSWGIGTHEGVYSLDYFGGNLYAGLGASANDAEVWKWDGSSWSKIGGDSINLGWGTNYEYAYSMTNDGTNLYVGLGVTANEAEVWRWNGTQWTKVADNGSGFSANYEMVRSLFYDGTYIYAGTGDSAGDGDVYRCSGCNGGSPTWTQIGGDTLNSSWANTTYEYVSSITSNGTDIFVGLGSSDGDGEVWRWDGSIWHKVGGDGANSSWNTAEGDAIFTLSSSGSTVYAGTYDSAGTGRMWTWNGSAWTQIGGNGINKSWGYYNLQSVEVMQWVGDYLYAGSGYATAGNALVWRFNGSNWEMIGGQGVNNSWGAFSYEAVTSMASLGGELYVGLGISANDAEVWKWDGSTWTQIGGDSMNDGWAANYEGVYSMASYAGKLYAGIGTSANDAEVWVWDGSQWDKIGGDNINNGWAANFEMVSSLGIYNGELYAGIGTSATEAEVWRWNGSAWNKVGGDGVSSSWNTSYETVRSMTNFGDKLAVGLGDSTGDAEIWTYDGSSWELIGGGTGSVNNSWGAGTYEYIHSLAVYNGKLYAGLGTTAGDGELWQFDGSTWTQIGGDSMNNGWDGNVEAVRSMSPYKGKLYAGTGLSGNSEDNSIWSWGDNGFVQSSTSSFDTSWHHVAATYNGSTMKLYIDGNEVGSQAKSLTIPDSSRDMFVGASWGGREQGKSRGYFQGQLDEVRISDIARPSFNSKPYSTTAQTITLNNPVRINGVWHWDNLTANETANGGDITYRLSADNGVTWKFWNGSSWADSNNTTEANPISVADANMSTFPVTLSGIKWQAVLKSNGDQRVTLNSVTLASTSDLVEPATNASNITALKASGGSSLAQNAWTNGSSPYFSWTAGTDTDSGIKGYCLYLGTDGSADPVTTKGILGNSPADNGGRCQFLIETNSIDTATAGTIQTALATGNSPYYLTIKAMDNAGNVTTGTTQFHFRFDNTPPTNPSYITAPSGFINTKDVTLTWPTSGGGAPDDPNSGLAGLQYKIGNTVWYGDSHSGTGDMNDLLSNDGSYQTITTPDHANLTEGVNTVYFRTWDQAGNVTASYVTAAIKINTSGAPSEPQNVTANPTTNTTNSFSFSWNQPATFVGNANNITYCYTVNILPSANNCTFTSGGTTSLGAGPYATQPGLNTLYVVAKDESNNINYSSYSSVNFTANTPSPGIPLNTDIVDVSIKATNNWRLALTWDAPTYTGAGISSYKVYRSTNNVSFSFVGSSSSTTYIDAGLSQQRYYYRVTACDSTNNCGSNSTTVNQIPTGKFTSPATLVADPKVSNITTRKATISWSTDRSSDSKIAIGTASGKYSSSEIASSDQVSSHQIDLNNLSAGTTYYYVAKWTDEDGNTGTSQEFTFQTAPAPSLKEITTSKVGLANASIRFTSKNASRIDVLYGKGESFGGIKSINTSPYESTYEVSIDGLEDGSKYFYKLVAYDKEDNSYDGSVSSFTTPARPKILDLRFQPIAGEPTSTQEVSWTTNVPATSTVTYGKVGQAGIDVQDSQLTTDHKLILRGLEDNSEYFLIAQSRDGSGNLAESDRQQFKTALDTRPPKISEVQIETSIRGTGAEARGQVVVSWKTDEPSSSQVAYGEGSNTTVFNNKTSEDVALGTEHIVIVSDLPTSRVYSIQPLSKDKSGNVGQGEPQSAIIGRASDSVLTIILNSLQKVFGF